MHIWRNTFLLCGALGLSGACGVTRTKDKGKKFTQVDRNLADTWKTDCVATTVLNLAKSTKDYRYSAIGDFDRRENFFADENCQDKLLTYELLGTYQALGEAPGGHNVKQVNYTVTKALATPYTDKGAELLNSAKACGSSEWRKDEEREVTGQDCFGYKVQKGDVVYGVYQIVNDDTLLLGGNFMLGTQLSLTSRPEDVDKDVPFRSKR